MNIVMKGLSEIHPYENNPRMNDKAAAAVAKSIQACVSFSYQISSFQFFGSILPTARSVHS